MRPSSGRHHPVVSQAFGRFCQHWREHGGLSLPLPLERLRGRPVSGRKVRVEPAVMLCSVALHTDCPPQPQLFQYRAREEERPVTTQNETPKFSAEDPQTQPKTHYLFAFCPI